MKTIPAILACLSAVSLLVAIAPAQSKETTRITDANFHKYAGTNQYAYRTKVDYIFEELDIKAGDIVVDIGAGDGWWSERLAPLVGEKGIVHSAEVEQKLVDAMLEKFADTPNVKPLLCPYDGPGLPENSVDLAFISQVYHHFDMDARVDYLKGLREVVRPTGRLAIIEKHSDISARTKDHGSYPSHLTKVAEEAGWVMVRYELMPKTYHFMAIFAQRELFPAEPQRRRRRRGGEETLKLVRTPANGSR